MQILLAFYSSSWLHKFYKGIYTEKYDQKAYKY